MTIISQLVNKQLINLEGVGENQKDLLQQLSKTLFDKGFVLMDLQLQLWKERRNFQQD